MTAGRVARRMYDEILLPTDGSPASGVALDHALDIAGRYDARIHALFAVDSGAFAGLESGTETVMEALRADGEDATGRVVDAAADAGLETVAEIRTGTPHRTILEYADEAGIDMIVMGTHGRQGLDRYLMGSVTERVVRTADVPVLTVRQPSGD